MKCYWCDGEVPPEFEDRIFDSCPARRFCSFDHKIKHDYASGASGKSYTGIYGSTDAREQRGRPTSTRHSTSGEADARKVRSEGSPRRLELEMRSVDHFRPKKRLVWIGPNLAVLK